MTNTQVAKLLAKLKSQKNAKGEIARRFKSVVKGSAEHQALLDQIKQEAAVNTELKERNRILAAEVYDLKNGAEAIEEHARLDLGLIKPHETFVQMSTVSTNYKPIYIDPTAQVDVRTNERAPTESEQP